MITMKNKCTLIFSHPTCRSVSCVPSDDCWSFVSITCILPFSYIYIYIYIPLYYLPIVEPSRYIAWLCGRRCLLWKHTLDLTWLDLTGLDLTGFNLYYIKQEKKIPTSILSFFFFFTPCSFSDSYRRTKTTTNIANTHTHTHTHTHTQILTFIINGPSFFYSFFLWLLGLMMLWSFLSWSLGVFSISSIQTVSSRLIMWRMNQWFYLL